jgi:WD40 repeat protein
VLLWDLQAARPAWIGRSEKGGEVLDLAFEGSSSRLVSAHRETIAEVWRVPSGEHEGTIQTKTAPFAVAIDGTGRQCALGLWTGDIEVWDLDRRQRVRVLTGHSRLVTALDFDRTSGRLFSASRDGTVRVWDVGGAHELAQLAREPVGIEGLRVATDGTMLIFATENGRIVRIALAELDRYVDANTGAALR